MRHRKPSYKGLIQRVDGNRRLAAHQVLGPMKLVYKTICDAT